MRRPDYRMRLLVWGLVYGGDLHSLGQSCGIQTIRLSLSRFLSIGITHRDAARSGQQVCATAIEHRKARHAHASSACTACRPCTPWEHHLAEP